MKKWILVVALMSFVVGYVGSNYVENRRYKKFFATEVSNPDNLILAKNVTSLSGADYAIILNPVGLVAGTTIFHDTQPVDWGTMELQFRITGTP